MKIISAKNLSNGKTRAIVELEANESAFNLVIVHPHKHYKLGYPLEDVILGEMILDGIPVTWCSIEQKWIR